MKRFVLSIGLLRLALSGALFGGDWSVGIGASPAITIPGTSFQLPSPRNRFNYSFGVVAVYDLTPNLFGKGVLQYTRKDILLAKNIPDTRSSLDPATGRIDPSRIVYGDATEVYESVALPLTLNCRLMRGGSIELVLSGGIETGYLFQRKVVVEPTTSGTSSHSEPEHGFVAALTMGIGLCYALSPDLNILLTPMYSYSHYPERDFGSLNFHTFSLESVILFRL